MVELTIDGVKVSAPEGMTVLEAAKKASVKIPTLCNDPWLEPYGGCRLCIVEVDGVKKLPASCVLPVREGMVVRTNTPRLRDARTETLKLILAAHPADCKTCEKHGHCELQNLSSEFNIRDFGYPIREKRHYLDESSPSITRDYDKCILCGRCVRVCRDRQTVAVYDFVNRGGDTAVTPAMQKNMKDTACVSCGQCTIVCPTGSAIETDSVDEVNKLLASGKHLVAQVAPSIRVSIGELFGNPPGTVMTGKIVTALKRLGFNAVFDTNTAADLTIMEESAELLEYVKEGKTRLSSSCCPAWINFIEEFYPDLIPYLSSCKSPQQMMGAMIKTYYAKQKNLKPEDIVVVSIMPCTAKKMEARRPEMNSSGARDVDAVLTTRELARVIKQAGIDFNSLPDAPFDEPLGIGSGAGALFGTTGGVTEAALRTAYEKLTGKPLQKLEFTQVRGSATMREAQVDLNGKKVKIVITNTLGAIRKVLEDLRCGKQEYQFVEVMACPGGCIGGGGQPVPPKEERDEVLRKRAQAIYDVDKSLSVRKSHENPAIKKLYADFLGAPLSETAKKYLHTTYTPKKGYGI